MAFKSEESKFKFGIRFRATSFFYILLLIATPYAAGYLIFVQIFSRYMSDYELEGVFQTNSDIILVIKNKLLGDGEKFLDKDEIKLFNTHKNKFEPNKLSAPGFVLAGGDKNSAWFVYNDHILKFDGKNFESKKLSINLPKYSEYNALAVATPDGLALIYSDEVRNWLFTIDQQGNQANVEIPCLQRCRSSDQPPCHCFSVGGNTLFYYQNQLWHFGRTWTNMYLQTISQGKASEWKEVCETPQICRIKGAHCMFFGGFDQKGIFFLVKDYNREQDKERKNFLIRFDGEKISAPLNYDLPDDFYFPKILDSEKGNARFFRKINWDFDSTIQQFEITDSGPKNYKTLFKAHNNLLSYLTVILYIAAFVAVIIIYIFIVDMLMKRYGKIGKPDIKFAPLRDRALAFLIDMTVWTSPLAIALIIMKPPFFVIYEYSPAKGLAILSAWLVCYFLLISVLEAEWGVSLGKLIMGLRVTAKDGKRPGLVKALVRNLLLVVDSLFGFIVGVAFMAYTDNWQRLGDLAAGTVVVKSKKTG